MPRIIASAPVTWNLARDFHFSLTVWAFFIHPPIAIERLIWEFPKIGDPHIVPYIVGSLLQGPKIRYP